MKNWMILDKYFSKNIMSVLFNVASKCGEVLLFWMYFDVNLIFQTWHICGKRTVNFSIVTILFSHVGLFCMLFNWRECFFLCVCVCVCVLWIHFLLERICIRTLSLQSFLSAVPLFLMDLDLYPWHLYSQGKVQQIEVKLHKERLVSE